MWHGVAQRDTPWLHVFSHFGCERWGWHSLFLPNEGSPCTRNGRQRTSHRIHRRWKPNSAQQNANEITENLVKIRFRYELHSCTGYGLVKNVCPWASRYSLAGVWPATIFGASTMSFWWLLKSQCLEAVKERSLWRSLLSQDLKVLWGQNLNKKTYQAKKC